LFERGGGLALAGELKCLIFRAGMQGQATPSPMRAAGMEGTRQTDLGGKLDSNDRGLPGSVTGKPPNTALTSWANHRLVVPVHTELQTVESVRDFGLPTGIRPHRPEQLNMPFLLGVHQVSDLHIPGIHEMNVGLQVTAQQIGLDVLKHFIILLRSRDGRDLDDEPG